MPPITAELAGYAVAGLILAALVIILDEGLKARRTRNATARAARRPATGKQARR